MRNQNLNRGADAVFEEELSLRMLLRFALPTILSLLVNTFYNIADQIFIGHGMGYLGNAAVNVVFPVMSFSVAVSALISDGAAAYMSLALGRKERDKASDTVVAALILAVVCGLAITVVGQQIARPLLDFLAATEAIAEMALTYLRIILLGIPMVLLSTVLTGLIRADGSPRYAMFCMVPGCLVNIVLDALFIFAFSWGIAGAAWATVIGQAVNLAVALVYLPRFRTVELRRQGRRKLFSVARGFLWLGIAGFVSQFAGTVYTVFVNRHLEYYGALSVYGADIPLAVFGIMMKVGQIAMCFMNGIAVGIQPILGYNYGRRRYDRVKSCMKTAVLVATGFGVIAFGIFVGLPRYIMLLFGQSDPVYLDFGVKCFRIFLLAAPVYGFSIVSIALFQALGKPMHSTFMALAQRTIYFLPLIALLARRYGVMGVLYASPVSDVFACITCGVLFAREWRRLSRPEHSIHPYEQKRL